MADKDSPKTDVVEHVRFVFGYITLARESIKSKDESVRLSSALIYSNLAEFLGESILRMIIIRIQLQTINSPCKPKELSYSDPTNLEAIIRRLEQFEFPLSEEILPLLVKIKKCRNKLLHNLLNAKVKGLDNDKLIDALSIDVEKLFELWSDFGKKLGM